MLAGYVRLTKAEAARVHELIRWIPADAIRSGQVGRVWQGVALGRLGRGQEAWTTWAGIVDASLGPWVAAEKGRVLRELGLHAEAEALEAPAFEDCDDVGVRAMLAIGLTADAVGRNEIGLARHRLETANGLVASAGSSPTAQRQRLRLAWVTAEVALLAGELPVADGLPEMGSGGTVAWPSEHLVGTDFHRAKGLLFGGVVRRDPRLLEAAISLAPPILSWAIHLARADLFGHDALDQARRDWQAIQPPAHVAAAVAATSVGRRFSS